MPNEQETLEEKLARLRKVLGEDKLAAAVAAGRPRKSLITGRPMTEPEPRFSGWQKTLEGSAEMLLPAVAGTLVPGGMVAKGLGALGGVLGNLTGSKAETAAMTGTGAIFEALARRYPALRALRAARPGVMAMGEGIAETGAGMLAGRAKGKELETPSIEAAIGMGIPIGVAGGVARGLGGLARPGVTLPTPVGRAVRGKVEGMIPPMSAATPASPLELIARDIKPTQKLPQASTRLGEMLTEAEMTLDAMQPQNRARLPLLAKRGQIQQNLEGVSDPELLRYSPGELRQQLLRAQEGMTTELANLEKQLAGMPKISPAYSELAKEIAQMRGRMKNFNQRFSRYETKTGFNPDRAVEGQRRYVNRASGMTQQELADDLFSFKVIESNAGPILDFTGGADPQKLKALVDSNLVPVDDLRHGFLKNMLGEAGKPGGHRGQMASWTAMIQQRRDTLGKIFPGAQLNRLETLGEALDKANVKTAGRGPVQGTGVSMPGIWGRLWGHITLDAQTLDQAIVKDGPLAKLIKAAASNTPETANAALRGIQAWMINASQPERSLTRWEQTK